MQWAFQYGIPIVSSYPSGTNVGAVLREAHEKLGSELGDRIMAIDSIPISNNDPQFFQVTIEKMATRAARAHALLWEDIAGRMIGGVQYTGYAKGKGVQERGRCPKCRNCQVDRREVSYQENDWYGDGGGTTCYRWSTSQCTNCDWIIYG